MIFVHIKKAIQPILNIIRTKYSNFNKEQRDITAKTAHAICIASVVAGGMRVLSDNVSGNEWELIIWLPCAIIFYALSVKALEPGEKNEFSWIHLYYVFSDFGSYHLFRSNLW